MLSLTRFRNVSDFHSHPATGPTAGLSCKRAALEAANIKSPPDARSRVNLPAAESKLQQYCDCILPQGGRRTSNVSRRRRQLDRNAENRIGPAVAWAVCCTISRAASWGSASTSSTARTGPHGTPAPTSAVVHSARVRCAHGATQSASTPTVSHAALVCREPRVTGRRLEETGDATESLPLFVVPDGKHHRAVFAA